MVLGAEFSDVCQTANLPKQAWPDGSFKFGLKDTHCPMQDSSADEITFPVAKAVGTCKQPVLCMLGHARNGVPVIFLSQPPETARAWGWCRWEPGDKGLQTHNNHQSQ